jgi:hypothetical protein
MKDDKIDQDNNKKKVCRRKFLTFCGKGVIVTASYEIFSIFDDLSPANAQILAQCCPQGVECVKFFGCQRCTESCTSRCTECTSRCVDSCTSRCTECTSRCVDSCTSRCTECTSRCVDSCTSRCTECTSRCIQSCTSGCTSGCIQSCTSGCTSGCTKSCIKKVCY